MFPFKPLSAHSKFNLMITPYNSLYLCLFSYCFFYRNVVFPLKSYPSLKVFFNCLFLCGAPLVAQAGCNIILLSNLEEVCFYYLYSNYCQNGYSKYLSIGMAKYWPIKRGPHELSALGLTSAMQQSWFHMILVPPLASFRAGTSYVFASIPSAMQHRESCM